MNRLTADDVKLTDMMFGSDDDSVEGEADSHSADNKIPYAEVRENLSVGGGRGIFATTFVPAGSLILSELPIIQWNASTDFSSVVDIGNIITEIFSSPAILSSINLLYPRPTDIIPEQSYDDMKALFDEHDGNYLSDLRSMCNCSMREAIRVALVIRHNGFKNGLYTQQCMMNHSCLPNCIKLTPGSKYAPSEIWSTRDVALGEELTISYVYPLESTALYTRTYLKKSHCFECRCPSCEAGELSDSVLSEDEIIELENKVQKCENQYTIDISDKPSTESRCGSHYRDILGELLRIPLLRFNLRLDILCTLPVELTSETPANQDISRGDIFVRVRLLKCCVRVALAWVGASEAIHEDVSEDAAVLFLWASLMLYFSQVLHLGHCHPDVGSTVHDILEGLRGIRLKFPALLEAYFSTVEWQNICASPETGSFANLEASISAAMLRCEKQIAAMKQMYCTASTHPQALKLIGQTPGSIYWGSDT
mmetsp:Transcript_4045/g.6272  ORF Transcript_4045/g.6272 Transcript_4045/m.6272 type:complete len:481 (+) Transcript_4045:141-1583(+)|eukprot:CAMPEP_0185038598 /NCGR_PEP_ID=MMETSP1103-20130426/34455_1 /TAXON_ID=36769 /ORGANISM="Paraphysomonas bandaiensis, Strain Caron Lab Isolate" /LENGTH=480 /DNA_ID=CAMNT_0027577109 /DNA_START=70 /DNA_END=1512 /DNA_ORIENTATION=-